MTRTKLHLLVAVAPLGLALGGPALGADLSTAAPLYKAPPIIAAPYSWTGFYVGANLGYGVGQDAGSYAFGPAPVGNEIFNATPGGLFGGGQIGYNLQFGSVVIGAETDLQGSGISDTRTCLLNCSAASSALITQKLDWFGTTRVRAGLATGPVLTYVTGGLAYGETETGITTNFLGASSGAMLTSSNRTGWTWGTGLEAALGGNWTAKAEYLYVDLGSKSVASIIPATGFTGVVTTKYQEQMFRAGVNYKLGAAQSDASFGPAYNWNGFFVGGTFGYGIGRDPSSLVIVGSNEAFDLSPRGYLGGALAGYNWQFGRWVAGIDNDIQGSYGDGYLTCVLTCFAPAATTINQKTPWLGTTRGRVGYAVGPALFYGTAGVAYGEVKDTVTQVIPGSTFAQTFDHTNVGWTVGGGIENKLDIFGLLGPHWTTRTEYLYVDLGNVTDNFVNAGAAQTLSSNVHEHIWRTTVTYKFGDTGFVR